MIRKILSLVLALMMIVSVAAAMPVSAEVADIVIAGGSFTSQGKTETAGTGQFYGKQVWATANAGYLYADYALEVVTAGYYDITIDAAGAYANGGYPTTYLVIDDQQIHGNCPAVIIGAADIITTDIARVYLTAGTHALRVVEQSAHFNLEAITFSYDATQTAATTLNLKPSAGSTTTTGRTFFYGDVPAEGSVSWATPHDVGFYQGSTASNANLTIPFVNGAKGYYDVIIASAGTTDATINATIGDDVVSGTLAATTSKNDVQEVNLGSIEISEGANTLNLTGSIGSTMKYLYNIKLVWSAVQPVPHIDLEPTDGASTSASYVFSSTTAAPTTKDADWIDAGRDFIYGNSKGHGRTGIPYTVTEAGYYDVLVGVGYTLTNGQIYVRLDGVGTVEGEAIQTTGGADVKVNNLGRVYLPVGSSTLDIKAALMGGNTSTHLYIWDIRLEWSDDQTEADEIILNAGFAKATSGTGEQNRMDWNVGTNTAGWATNSVSKLSSPTTYIDLDMYVTTGAYYDVYAAAGVISNTGMLSLRIGGTEVIDKAYLTYDGTSSLSNVQETYVGKVYIPAGSVDLRAESDTNSGGYYLYNLKFTKSVAQPIENEIRIIDKGGLDLDFEFYAGTEAFAEVMTTSDVKVFIVNYKDIGDGVMKMSTCQEGEVLLTDGDIKIIRTSAPLTASAGSVKAFVWNGTTYAPIDMAQATALPVPEAETPAE